jgi:hypothetical protein
MRQSKMNIMLFRPVGKSLRVMAGRRTFQSMKEHQQGSVGATGTLPIYIDEVAIRGCPAFAQQG